MNDIIITRLPQPHGEITGWWYKGFSIHKGRNEESLNYSAVYAQDHHIIPLHQNTVNDWNSFYTLIQSAGFTIHLLDFPDELNQPESIYHDAIFVRDAGIMYQDLWIQSRFSAIGREKESHVYSQIIPYQFQKKCITLTDNAFIEGGEVIFLRTKHGSFYFGGLSRANQEGHEFVCSIMKPDCVTLIHSQGYHLDTLFTPVLSSDNEILALLVVKKMLYHDGLLAIEKLGIPIIEIEPFDSSGEGEELGNYAANCLLRPGVMVNTSPFITNGVEKQLWQWNIQRYCCPLPNFRYSGGSYHCLTNEMYH